MRMAGIKSCENNSTITRHNYGMLNFWYWNKLCCSTWLRMTKLVRSFLVQDGQKGIWGVEGGGASEMGGGGGARRGSIPMQMTRSILASIIARPKPEMQLWLKLARLSKIQ